MKSRSLRRWGVGLGVLILAITGLANLACSCERPPPPQYAPISLESVPSVYMTVFRKREPNLLPFKAWIYSHGSHVDGCIIRVRVNWLQTRDIDISEWNASLDSEPSILEPAGQA
jgi:hypothetical protein